MAQIFAYIEHKGGVADDSAVELVAAAKRIDAAATPTAVLTGCGADLDAVSNALCASYGEVWKITSEALAPCPFRSRSRAGSFHQAELTFCLRRVGHRRG